MRSVIHTTKSLLLPKVIDNDLAKSKIKSQKALQKFYSDKGSKELPKISCGEKVRVLQGKTWNPAIVKEKANTQKSFILRCPDGSTYRRNRKHILKTNEEQTRLFETDEYDILASQSNGDKTINEQCQENIEEERIEDQAVATSEEHGDNAEPLIKTRSGRVIKKTNKL